MQPIHFFRKGRHTAMSGKEAAFSEAELREIAESYDAEQHEAPLVVGHPKTDDPAFGWVKRVVVKPDGLYAEPHKLNADFAEMVKGGSFGKVSASFYQPNGKGNPTPGKWHLRHIGFLGAQPPAVKGLRPIEFADEEAGVLNFEEGFFELREFRLAERERAFERDRLRQRLKDANLKGVLPKTLLDGALAFAETLEGTDTFEFGEGDDAESTSQREWFLDFVERLPMPVAAGEIAGGTGDDEPTDFASPEGYTVDAEAAGIRDAAMAYAKKEGVPFEQAVRIVAANTYTGAR